MLVTLKSGKSVCEVSIPDEHIQSVLTPNDAPRDPIGVEAVLQALTHPTGTKRLRDIVEPGEAVAIITSDITRPMPTHLVRPSLLDELYAARVSPANITLVFALGSHRFHSDDEKRQLAGERVFAEITCVDGDPADCASLGTTTIGTPVDIVRVVAEADRRICLGNIEYHYFAGYSGGAKAIMPGVSTRETIQANHRHMINPAACAGKLQGNPIREDIEEAGQICGIDFILNVVLDERKPS